MIALDATVTGLHKADYWQRVYRRYGIGGQGQRHFLVAVHGGRVVGFIIGEVRDWEFGSPPCGWVFAIDVDPGARQAGVGTRLLAAMRERFGAWACACCARCWPATTRSSCRSSAARA